MNQLDDKFIIERILAGEESFFDLLVSRYGDRVYTLIRNIVSNDDDAQELVQDTFLKVYTSLARFKGDSSFSTWIYRIAYNTAISKLRRRRAIELPLSDEYYRTEDADDNIYTDQDVALLAKALTVLPVEDSLLLSLFYFEDKSILELMAITDMSESNVKVRLHRSRKKLKLIMEELRDE